MESSDEVREVKVCILGDAGVGKSSLLIKFITGKFNDYQESTVGAAYMQKSLVHAGQNFKMQIWDTAGQERYHSLAPMYYKGASGALLVFDLTRASSFETLREWAEELKVQGPAQIALGIAANKADLDDSREVDEDDAREYAESIGAMYFETSAKEDENDGPTYKLFTGLLDRLPPRPVLRKDDDLLQLNKLVQKKSEERKCC